MAPWPTPQFLPRFSLLRSAFALCSSVWSVCPSYTSSTDLSLTVALSPSAFLYIYIIHWIERIGFQRAERKKDSFPIPHSQGAPLVCSLLTQDPSKMCPVLDGEKSAIFCLSVHVLCPQNISYNYSRFILFKSVKNKIVWRSTLVILAWKSKGFGSLGTFVKDVLVVVDLFQMDFDAWETKTGWDNCVF